MASYGVYFVMILFSNKLRLTPENIIIHISSHLNGS